MGWGGMEGLFVMFMFELVEKKREPACRLLYNKRYSFCRRRIEKHVSGWCRRAS
jgi:hypothetical protein